jgi:L-ascorbate metabolism protein UlaG (beta-lactamase superfamily)
MKRRELIRYASASLLTTLGTAWMSRLQSYQAKPKPPTAQPDSSLLVQWLGHSCFLFTGGGIRILVNPFRALGCTARYRVPKVEADLVLLSSFLWDEGGLVEELPGKPKILTEPGVYDLNNLRFQGISVPHDREGGRRFGTNITWRWQQGGIKILHLGGAAAPIELEQKILMGTPDLLFIPVGGSPKNYNPQEAKQAIEVLKPKIVIPTQYLTQAADKSACNLVSVDEFTKLFDKKQVQFINSNQIRIKPGDLPKEGTLIRVLSDKLVLT